MFKVSGVTDKDVNSGIDGFATTVRHRLFMLKMWPLDVFSSFRGIGLAVNRNKSEKSNLFAEKITDMKASW